MRGWTVGLGAAAVLALASCANPRNEMAARAPQTLVGMPKAELLACAGVPRRSVESGGVEHLAYSRERTIVERDVDWEPDPWIGRGFMRPDVMVFTHHYRCEATFLVRDGRVAELRYDPGRDLELCWEIVANCVR